MKSRGAGIAGQWNRAGIFSRASQPRPELGRIRARVLSSPSVASLHTAQYGRSPQQIRRSRILTGASWLTRAAVAPLRFGRAVAYSPAQVERKWQKIWTDQEAEQQRKTLEEALPSREDKYYVLSMFPYPSGQLHMGHVRVYTISDTLARYQRMKGKKVLHPMGWDAFGLPAENAAIERGIQPQEWTYDNISVMKNQMLKLGLKFDWDKEVATCSPDYYKWTQWIFLKLHQAGLAYQKEAFVNWDPIDKTVLANEQVDKDGRSWRSGAKVEQKLMRQWFFHLTHFAEDLVKDLDTLPKWPDKVKLMQEHWLGRSPGAVLDFEIDGGKELDSEKLRVFTTRADTLFGVTYLVVAAEHPLVSAVLKSSSSIDQTTRHRLSSFVQELSNSKHRGRQDLSKSKNGIYLGINARHPITNETIPIYVADYVLMDYGTGAAMGVPAHDERDFEFAANFGIPVKQVIRPPDGAGSKQLDRAYCDEGVLFNSGEFTGLSSQQARTKIADLATQNSFGAHQVNYKVKDWLLSRQRYWGAPIPMVYCKGHGPDSKGCGVVPVPEEQLPVILPHDIHISAKGGSPLAQHTKWLHTTCPKCGGPATRDTDTMDTFVDSAWYFLRYPDAKNSEKIFSKESTDRWMPMDIYIGGIEHAILHLLYSRFITKFLHSSGYLACNEPFPQLLTQGLVTGRTYKDAETGEFVRPEYVEFSEDAKPIDSRNGKELAVSFEKMSKSKYNGTDPNQIVKQWGADTARLFVLFKAPPQLELQWEEEGVVGQYRWLNRLWAMVEGLLRLERKESKQNGKEETNGSDSDGDDAEQPKVADDGERDKDQERKEMLRAIHDAIAHVSADLEGPHFTFNTAVAELMTLSNKIKPTQDIRDQRTMLNYMALRSLVLMLAPMAPHIAAEMWSNLQSCKTLRSMLLEDTSLSSHGNTSTWLGDSACEDVLAQRWPKHVDELRKKDEIVVAIQISGRMRGTISVPADLKEDASALEQIARESPIGRKYLTGHTVRRVIVPPKANQPIINFVL